MVQKIMNLRVFSGPRHRCDARRDAGEPRYLPDAGAIETGLNGWMASGSDRALRMVKAPFCEILFSHLVHCRLIGYCGSLCVCGRRFGHMAPNGGSPCYCPMLFLCVSRTASGSVLLLFCWPAKATLPLISVARLRSRDSLVRHATTLWTAGEPPAGRSFGRRCWTPSYRGS